MIDFFLHLDQHLVDFVTQYGYWVYALLFAIVFCETGLVFMPFLPGDNLLFAAGAIAAIGQIDPWLVAVVLGSAAILGDSTNYWVGRTYGLKIFDRITFIDRKHLTNAEQFFNKHGGKSVMLGRFIPFIRTFTPFVAGMGRMDYRRFLFFSITGTIIWVGSLVTAGYYLGQLPFVKENLTVIVLLVIFISILPLVIQGTRHYIQMRRGR